MKGQDIYQNPAAADEWLSQNLILINPKADLKQASLVKVCCTRAWILNKCLWF